MAISRPAEAPDLSRTVEDYLKRIYLCQQEVGRSTFVPMGRLAAVLDVAPGTATAMVKRLDERGLITYEPYSGVKLRKKGERAALAVLRRHRLIETFLVEVLGLDWSEVHEEAERLEHAMSDPLLERIDAHLGHPRTDPHGDPIPTPEGTLPDRTPEVGLHTCDEGATVIISRILDQDERFLSFADEHGLRPGQQITITQHDEVGGTMVIDIDGQPVTLGLAAAARVSVAPD